MFRYSKENCPFPKAQDPAMGPNLPSPRSIASIQLVDSSPGRSNGLHLHDNLQSPPRYSLYSSNGDAKSSSISTSAGHQKNRPFRNETLGHGHISSGVYISQAEYDSLTRTAIHYGNLCQNLISGGVDNATIELLSSQASTTTPAPSFISHALGSDVTCNGLGAAFRGTSAILSGAPSAAQHHRTSSVNECSDDSEEESHESFSSDGSYCRAISPSRRRSYTRSVNGDSTTQMPFKDDFSRDAMRSLTLSNLRDGTTHADITAVVRGGQILDVYIRWKDRAASISFIHAADAHAFFNYARKTDVYIKNKRVDIRWDDRQYILSPHLAYKIRQGASRNLVIRDCDSNITEQGVRDDLEHIHNLIAISIKFVRGDCFISTNSVHIATLARTCMMSRLKYKKAHIEWGVDECAKPLDGISFFTNRSATPAVPQKTSLSATNRFGLLRVEG
ncbi:hypothetical protein S40285_00394 [Stachybotrys chlorohalonatus IBT 40285]|uniref:RRM domain-containing protein n=1 Tax=Stachybotrys chlorohalonatus (strain IBT 40285) TaxID=1283841 RepID=A0A084QHW9_STAC4|nr:hypothetical protein S40285_00394 [Stachybotrys chlorohalonata IBT 40285]